ncbi:hypothetical protein F4Z99_10795 [Candidatus Poribacteria bacterium]|nr:hypothetical protein [Candidatus Poribacteria bacterium]MYA99087.1 hypothetical protein [Candidatus Poribacteria bacterium]
MFFSDFRVLVASVQPNGNPQKYPSNTQKHPINPQKYPSKNTPSKNTYGTTNAASTGLGSFGLNAATQMLKKYPSK